MQFQEDIVSKRCRFIRSNPIRTREPSAGCRSRVVTKMSRCFNTCLHRLSILFLCTILLLTAIKAQQNPTILQITPGQAVDLGDTIDLSCSVQYGADYPIIWTKLSDNPNSPPLFISRNAALTILDNRYSIRHDDSSSTYTLQVSKVRLIYPGDYINDSGSILT